MQSKIAILMSTYNGEKYLDEQINSVINQTNEDWHLYIRDDNSNDNTRKILNSYDARFDNITFVNKNSNKNVGVCRSFMALLNQASADFYMFCDQDDVWNRDKIQVTLDKIRAEDGKKALLAFTDLQVVDKKLNSINRMYGDRVWYSFVQFLFTNCATGCTIMLNDNLKQLVNFANLNYDDIYMHDWWLAMLAAQFGKVIYVNEPTIKYRQHEENVVGSGEENTFSRLVQRFFLHKSDVLHAQQIVRASHEFKRLYGNSVHGVDKEYLGGYSNLYDNSGFFNNLKLVLKLPAQRINPKGKIFYSYLFVLFSKKYKFSNG